MKKNQSKFLKKSRKGRSGKKLCIILMILFTLVLAADIANLFLTPAQSQISFAPAGFDRENGSFSMPEGGDFQMPEGGDFQMPEGGQMPGGDFQMPGGEMSGGDFQMPEGGFGEGEMPAFEGRPGGGADSQQGGILQTARRAWLPIAIVCILGDLVCLLILLRLRRKEKAVAEAFDGVPGMPELDEEEDPDEPPKRKRGPWAAILCMVTAFAMILAMIPTEDGDTSSANVQSQVISGTAETAQINTVLSGAGTLEADTLTPVTVPQQVTVLKYHVRNGETVTAGDPLVSVDKTSASSAMMDLSEVLEDLDDDLETERRSSNSTYIYSTAAGRIKKIFAAQGDSVTDVLYEHGALMLLSLDGTMQVTFSSEEALKVGDLVTVQYSGISEEGRIATVREGKVTVTLSDEKAPYDGEATIVNPEGKTLGTGKLQVSSPLKVISYYGTVDNLLMDVNDKVSVGTALMTLKNTGDTADYQILLARRNELEAQMQKLSQLARTGMVYAENDGIVSGVPDDAEIELLSGSGTAKADLLSNSSGGWKLILLTQVVAEEPDAGGDQGGGDQTGGDQGGGGQTGGDQTGGDQTGGDQTGGDQTGGDQTGGDQTGGDQTGCDQTGGDQTGGDQTGGDQTGGDQTGGDQTGGDQTGGNQTGGDQTGGDQTGGDQTGGDQTGGDQTGGDQTGGDQTGGDQGGGDQTGGDQGGGDQTGGDQTGGDQTGGGQTGSDQTGGNQTGGDQTGGDQTGGDQTGGDQTGGDQTGGDQGGNNQGGESQSARYYAACITKVDGTSVSVAYSDDGAITADSDPRLYITAMNKTDTFQLDYANLSVGDYLIIQIHSDGTATVAKHIATGENGGNTPGGNTPGGAPSGGGGMPSGGGDGGFSGGDGGFSGSMGSGGGMSGGMPSGGTTTVQESYEQYAVEETELLYVSDQKEIAVTISVDELDILSLSKGLEAKVTLDAMKGQSFTGQIVRIGSEGTNDGGNTKFSVTVVLPREAMMLDGMNASVKVVTATSEAAVAIPAAALVEEDGKTYVYTTYDQETDTLGGLTEVETGASDGELVEILSGLNVGDIFYYRYADTVTYSFLTAL